MSGHCYWAYGLYHSKENKTPYVVASVCGSDWLSPLQLFVTASTKRGDKKGDLLRGGYNVVNLPIVCDLLIPGGLPEVTDNWILKSEEILLICPAKPKLLLFGKNRDIRKRLKTELMKNYSVDFYDDKDEFIRELKDDIKDYLV
jgi:hypothetical protein